MFTHYVKRTIKKIVTFPLWIVVSLFYLVCKPLTFLLRCVSFLGCPALLLMAILNYIDAGFTTITIQSFVAGIALLIFILIAPYIPSLLCNFKYKLKNAAFKPIVVRPPVRFTYKPVHC